MNYNFHTGTIINYFVQVQIMPELPAAAAVLVPAILERLEPLRPQQVLAVDLVATPHHHQLLAGLPGLQIQTRLSHPRGPCHEGKTITKLQIQNEVLPTFSSRSVQSRFGVFFVLAREKFLVTPLSQYYLLIGFAQNSRTVLAEVSENFLNHLIQSFPLRFIRKKCQKSVSLITMCSS